MDIYSLTLLGLPLWIVFLITILVVTISITIGSKMGEYSYNKRKDISRESVSSIVSASLLLLAFMLAFTFGISASRYESRKELILDEVNTVGTAYLRAGLLNETAKKDIQKLLMEYVNLRAELTKKR